MFQRFLATERLEQLLSAIKNGWRYQRTVPPVDIEDLNDTSDLYDESLELVKPRQLLRPFLLLLVLVTAVVLSALTVIFSAYEYRQLFNEHQQLMQQRDDYQVEWGQLLLEQSAWAANSRVEKQVRERLKMKVPEGDDIEIIRHVE